METVSDASREVILKIENGLHLAPISRIVGGLSEFQASVRIEFDDRSADARSATDLMLLAATCGAPLRVLAEGADAEAAVQAVVAILEKPEPPREPPVRPR